MESLSNSYFIHILMSPCPIPENLFRFFPFLTKTIVCSSTVYKVRLPHDPSFILILFSPTITHPVFSLAPTSLSFIPLIFPSVTCITLPHKGLCFRHPFFLRQHHLCLRFNDVLQQASLDWGSGLTIKIWYWGRGNSHTERGLWPWKRHYDQVGELKFHFLGGGWKRGCNMESGFPYQKPLLQLL